MKKISPLSLGILSLLSTLSLASAADSQSDRKTHIAYFGYFGIAAEWIGTGDYMSEAADHTNIVTIAGSAADLMKKVKKAKSINQKVFLDVSTIFLDVNRDFDLLPDYKKRWSDFAAILKPYEDVVAAFYPLDEPYCQARHHGASAYGMRVRMEAVAKELKASFPSVPVAMVYTNVELNSDLNDENFFPKGFDWFGFDCYGSWNACYGNSIPGHLNVIKRHLKPGQHMFLIPDGIYTARSQQAADPGEMEALATRANQYYQLAQQEPLVIAMLPFIWESTPDSGNGTYLVGVRDMPPVRKAFEAIGKDLLLAHAKEAGTSSAPKRSFLSTLFH